MQPWQVWSEDLQHVRSARVSIEDGQAQLARLGDAVGVHVKGLVPDELGGEEVAHRLPYSSEAAHEDVVAVILLRV